MSMKSKDFRLYNIIFPIWLLWIWPMFWVVVLPANFGIDSLVLLLAARRMEKAERRALYKRTILKVWAFGFAADAVGALWLLLSMLIDSPLDANSPFGAWWRDNICNPVTLNPFESVLGFLWTAIGLGLAGYLIYLFNYKFTFKKEELEAAQKKRLSLVLALATAPYVFLIPSIWLYGW